MRPISVSFTDSGNGASNPAQIDHYQSPINIGFVVVVTGTITVSVQHTYDNATDSNVTPVWYDHATVKNVSATTEGTYTSPIFALRLNKTAGTGSAVLKVMQAGGKI